MILGSSKQKILTFGGISKHTMLRFSLFFLFLIPMLALTQEDDILDQYMQKREALLRLDSLQFEGYGTPLTPDEKILSRKMKQAQRAKLETYKAEHFFPPSRNFYQSKTHIEQDLFFRLLRTMPKGGALHLHDLAIADAAWIVRKAMETPEMHVYWGKDNPRFIKGQMHAYAPGSAPENFFSAQELAQKNPNFQQELLELITFDERIDGDSVDIWQKFEAIFQRVYGFVSYAPIYPEYLYQGLQILVEDHVQHVELRGRYDNHLYDLKHAPGELTHEDLMLSIRDVIARVRKLDPAFTLTLICANLRFMDPEFIWTDMQRSIEIHKQDPDLIKGYDLVAEEDNGNPTLVHVKQFLRLKSLIQEENLDFELYLHDGESSWMHVSNLYDAVLLGSRRIGHGFNLFRFPELMKLVKEKNMCIEVNPLSNQILGYVRDLRMHPASTYLRVGIDCVISSDDPQLFHYQGLSYDFWSAFMAWELDLATLKALSKNSLLHASLSDSVKKQALKVWEQRWELFIQNTLNNWHRFFVDPVSRKSILLQKN